MMRWAVYWEPDDMQIAWFPTEQEARNKIADLIVDSIAEAADNEGIVPDWEITLLQVRGEVHDSPDGLVLRAVKE